MSDNVQEHVRQVYRCANVPDDELIMHIDPRGRRNHVSIEIAIGDYMNSTSADIVLSNGDAVDLARRILAHFGGEKRLKRVYLAGPYSHTDPEVRAARAAALNRKAAWLMMQGLCVFSPITHGVALLDYFPYNERGWAFWGEQDRAHLLACDELHVLCLDGWRESRGVTDEIQWATEAGMPVIYHDCEGRDE
jgi:hypothetical protein